MIYKNVLLVQAKSLAAIETLMMIWMRKEMRVMMMRVIMMWLLFDGMVCLFVCLFVLNTLGSRLEMNWSLGRRMVRDESR